MKIYDVSPDCPIDTYLQPGTPADDLKVYLEDGYIAITKLTMALSFEARQCASIIHIRVMDIFKFGRAHVDGPRTAYVAGADV